MKKITFSLLILVATISFSYGQNLQIITPGGNKHLNDSTIVVYGDITDSLITQGLYVINTSGGSLTVNVKRKIISAVAGSRNEICWAGTCYDTNVAQSPSTETLGMHDTSNLGNTFDGDYLPHTYKGTTTIKYIFFDTHNANDTAVVTVKFIITLAGVASIKTGLINFSTPYPNPANSFVNFNYCLSNGVQSANLKIFNLIGDCVQTLPLSGAKNKTTIDVQSMPSGVYLCEIEANGCQPVYQKIIVSH